MVDVVKTLADITDAMQQLGNGMIEISKNPLDGYLQLTQFASALSLALAPEAKFFQVVGASVNMAALEIELGKLRDEINKPSGEVDLQKLSEASIGTIGAVGGVLGSIPVKPIQKMGIALSLWAALAKEAQGGQLGSLASKFGQLLEETDWSEITRWESDPSLVFEAAGLFKRASETRSPLILDLNGDGVRTLAANLSTVQFDHDGNTFAERSGWVDVQDGLLVLDKNGDGSIDSGSELFGNYTELQGGSNAQNGFLALADIDSNSDGVINSLDASFSSLQIWQDADGDGKVDEGELNSLISAGIASLNTAFTSSSAVDENGNEHRQIGSYTLTDGSSRAMEDVWFATNVAVTTELNPIALSPGVRALPEMNGMGNVRSLRQAMMRDTSGALQTLIESFADAESSVLRKSFMTEILYRWAGVQDVDPSSRSSSQIYGNAIGDARKLEALEEFLGEEYVGIWCWGQLDPNPHGVAAPILLQAFDDLSSFVYGKLVLQTVYKPYIDVLGISWDEVTGVASFDVEALVQMFADAYAADANEGLQSLSEFVKALATLDFGQTVIELMRNSGDVSGNTFEQTLAVISSTSTVGDAFANDLVSGAAADQLLGSGGDDHLYGNGGNDTLIGGAGDDYLAGGDGADTYIYGLGDGSDTIQNADLDGLGTNTDTLSFSGLIQPEDVIVKRIGYDLVLKIAGTVDKVTVHSFFDQDGLANQGYTVDFVTFANGTIWTAAQIKVMALAGTAENDTLIGYASADLINGFAGDDLIKGADGVDSIFGGDGADSLFGEAGADSISGGNGDDFLDGGAGADYMAGSLGNDTYFVDDVGDAVWENANEGDDLINSTISYSLQSNQEHLVLTGSGNLAGTGNSSANQITGNAGHNFLSGNDGNDTLKGGAGNDSLDGGSGNDSLDGGTGADSMSGGAGDDTYVVDSLSDLVVEALSSGNDTVISSVSLSIFANVENLTLSGAGNLNATGNSLANYITGNSGSNSINGGDGNDSLDGGAGSDTLVGGLGNDTYFVDSISDVVNELASEGTDTVKSTINWTLGAHLENLTLIGGGSISGTGNSVGNVIDGNAGDNSIDGQGGIDTMRGGLGNDSYVIDSLSDLIVEYANEGIDTVYSAFTITVGSNIENIVLTGSANINATGDANNNYLQGNFGNNLLTGGAGNDTLDARRSTFSTDAGVDTLVGGLGDDTYYIDHGYEASLYTDPAQRDVILENAGEGRDQVYIFGKAGYSYTLATNVEDLFVNNGGFGYVDYWAKDIPRELNGNSLDNVIDYSGDSFGAILDGGLGADTLRGSNARDVYVVDNSEDVVDERGGTDDSVYIDEVRSSVSYSLGNKLENLVLNGSSTITGTGNSSANFIDGSLNSASNVLTGLGGNDVYRVGAGDTVIEAAGGGNDVVEINYRPGNSVVDITAIGTSSIELYRIAEGLGGGLTVLGSSQADAMIYSSYNKVDGSIYGGGNLSGLGGNDLLQGAEGSDTLIGGDGNDTLLGGSNGYAIEEILDGGAGNDFLNGERGSDVYLFGIGDGHDIIDESSIAADGTSNTLRFKSGVSSSAVSIVKVGNDIQFQIAGYSDTITAQYFFNGSDPTGSQNPIKRVEFADGTVWTLGKIRAMADPSNPNVAPTLANDVADTSAFEGPSWSYTLPTNAFADANLGDTLTYSFKQSDGSALPSWMFVSGTTLYSNEPPPGSVNVLVTAMDDSGLSVSDVFQVTIQIENKTLTGTGGDDVLTGYSGNDTLTGLAGNDVLKGGIGADSMVGGIGDDTYYIDNALDTIVEASGEGSDTVFSSLFNYSLAANVEIGRLSGTASINLTGNTLNNALYGNSSANRLDGGTGADTLNGGGGSDTFVVDNVGDVIATDSENDSDLVEASIGYALATGLENLTLTGSAAINGTGNTSNNVLIGNSGANVLIGGAGADSLTGGAGNDQLNGDDGNDYLAGGADNDTLNGGIGNDTMVGGSGNDTYVIDAVGDVVTELASEGTDLVQSSVSYVLGANFENLTLTGTAALNGTGNSAANTITGNSGNNIIDGGVGADSMVGGAGNDTYIVDNVGDVVTEASSAGTDTVQSSLSYTLGTNLENLTLTGAGSTNATGNTVANYLTGNSGANVLNGGSGADTMAGGAGNDTYVVDNVGDVVIEYSGEGVDLVQSSVSFTLSAELENLTLTGTAAVNATGSSLANTIVGNSGANTLTGGGGADTISGGAGNDTYIYNVGNGADVISNQGSVSTDIDEIRLGSGILLADTHFYRDVDDLTITFLTAGDTIRVQNFFGNVHTERVIFNDNTTYTRANIPYSGPSEIFGTSGNDSMTGTANADFLHGQAGDDTLSGLDGNDTLYGEDGNDRLLGGNGNDSLVGGIGIDELDGGVGVDTMVGGDGSDYYYIDNSSDVVIELAGGGQDIVILSASYTLGENIENVQFYDGNYSVVGNALDNVIYGAAGNNTIDGGAGADTMYGGGGDDTFYVDNVGDVIGEYSDGFDSVYSSISYTLTYSVENLALTGSANLSATGNDSSNYLTGNSGNNAIDGSYGADTMAGGDGDDTYYVDNVGDVLVESTGAGFDVVYSSASIVLSENIEQVTLVAGAQYRNATGNSSNNLIRGNESDNVLDGAGGADTLIGGQGNDSYFVDDIGDVVTEFAGEGEDVVFSSVSFTLSETLEHLYLAGSANVDGTGNSLGNAIYGNSGNNVLDGGTGDDSMYGGLGNDTFIVNSSGDVIYDDGGIDLAKASVSYTLNDFVDNLTLTGTADIDGYGNFVANVITGNSGANILSGAGGEDTLIGGAGNDQYYVESQNDVVVEKAGEGTDVVYAASSYTLSANIENLTISEGNHFDATGNSLNNVLTGNSYNNVLDGGLGNDTMIGGGGSDTYIVDSAGDVIETSGFGIDLVKSTISYTLGANLENLTLLGTEALNGTGNSDNNSLVGNSGNNVLDGGIGADTMAGGAGNDTYIVDSLYDVVIEDLGSGYDSVQSSVTFTLGANLEKLTLTGAASVNASGNAADNVLTGNSGSNHLDGGAGIDTMAGGLGNDTYYLDDVNDVIIENSGEGNDSVIAWFDYSLSADLENVTLAGTGNFNATGNASANTLTGNSGNNRLDGGSGTDVMVGGLGDDVYVVDSTSDSVIESTNSGLDLVESTASFTLGANVENLTLLGSLAINGTGNASANVLIGNDANNVLNGGSGADTMTGGLGDDTYVVDVTGDVINEGIDGGTDLVQSSITYTLASTLENLTLTGTGAINATGNDAANVLTGNSGNNVLSGGLGADTMAGGAGNDTYVVDDVGDVVTEGSGAGTDLVQSSVTFTLGANVENLTLTGALVIDATGNTLANSLIGNAADNILDGGSGVDTMAGGLGNDTYVVDNAGDVVTEAASAGTDLVRSSVTYVIGSNIENLILTGVSAINGTGNTLSNVITGNSAANTLDGGSGADALIGGAGNDIYTVDNALDVVTELVGEGTDTVNASVSYTLSAEVEKLTLTGTSNINATGNELANTLTGNSGANILNGGAGNDTMIGGAGNDTYIVDSTADVVTEVASGGTDLVQASVSYTLSAEVENLTLTGTANINGTGNTLANSLIGNSGNNVLSGGTGADTMAGGLGDDTYVVDNVGDVVTEAASAGTDLVQSSITYTLGTNLENLTLTGTTAINGTGNTVANVITGNSADNVLNGGAGADTMAGGAGNDTYVVDNILDVVTENASAGTDLVQSSVTYTLSANIESLTLTGTASINGTGNASANTLTGNSGANILDGGAGADTMVGGSGNDTYVVDSASDVVTEVASGGTDLVQASVTYTLSAEVENLTLTGTTAINGTGNTLANTLTGNTGNNVLDGGAGNDTLIGGLGNDTYVVDSATDVITELAGEGTDLVQASVTYTLAANVENLTLTGTTAINGTGNTLANILTGNTADNVLSGGAGADTMIGGAGNDTYVVDDVLDVITEAASAGTDLVQSSVTYTLATNVENLTLTGTAAINATGNTLANVLTGNTGANVLDGGTGADTMIGGAGNDTYIVDNIGDVVTEAASGGTDLVQSSVTYTLSSDVESLTLTGTAAINATGNSTANTLTGNTGANVLDGGAGNDTMIGGAGNDTYVVDSTSDVVTELASEGTDVVQASATFTLGVNVENLTLTGTSAINGTGNTLANVLTGNSGANVLDGGAGNDSLIGGLGNDTYKLGRGYGSDQITENDSTSGNNDIAQFASDVAHDQIWFRQIGNNLEVSIIGTSDQFLINNWYLGSQYHVETFNSGNGKTMTDAQVQNMVQAMSAFSPPAAGQTTMPANYSTALAPTIAANWS